MDGGRHNKTIKNHNADEVQIQSAAATVAAAATAEVATATTVPDPFRNLLDASARDAFRRQWHRLERGLRLNRLRMYVEDMSAQCSFTIEEKGAFFNFLQNALDRKLLNTHKIVDYVPDLQKIASIKGLEVRRTPDGTAKWGFIKTKRADGTRKVRKGADKNEAAGQPSSTAQ